MLVAWTPLSPSRRERRLRQLAQVLAFGTALALLIAALRDAPVAPLPLLSALLAVLAGILTGRPARSPGLEVAVDDSGALAARRPGQGGAALEQQLQCVFAAPWLITLRLGTIWVRIWPDSVPGNVFRRCWVHIRWNAGRQSADVSAASAPDRKR